MFHICLLDLNNTFSDEHEAVNHMGEDIKRMISKFTSSKKATENNKAILKTINKPVGRINLDIVWRKVNKIFCDISCNDFVRAIVNKSNLEDRIA